MKKWIKYDNHNKLLNLDHVVTIAISKYTPYKGQTSGYTEKIYFVYVTTIFDRTEEIVKYTDEKSAKDMLGAIYNFIGDRQKLFII